LIPVVIEKRGETDLLGKFFRDDQGESIQGGKTNTGTPRSMSTVRLIDLIRKHGRTKTPTLFQNLQESAQTDRRLIKLGPFSWKNGGPKLGNGRFGHVFWVFCIQREVLLVDSGVMLRITKLVNSA